jgi:hypothetical protein
VFTNIELSIVNPEFNAAINVKVWLSEAAAAASQNRPTLASQI